MSMNAHYNDFATLHRCYELVLFIANDKITNDEIWIRSQRDDWQAKCRNLVNELNVSNSDKETEKNMTYVGYSW